MDWHLKFNQVKQFESSTAERVREILPTPRELKNHRKRFSREIHLDLPPLKTNKLYFGYLRR